MIVYAYTFLCDACGRQESGPAWELPQKVMESPKRPALPGGWCFVTGYRLWCHDCTALAELANGTL